MKTNIITRLSSTLLCSCAPALFLTGFVLASCSELEDKDHYSNTDSQITNEELKIVEQTSQQYIQSRADLSSMNQLFEEQGIYKELQEKGLFSTLLVVTNEDFTQPVADSTQFITRSHVSDISISPANLEDGTRLMMWHGKYVNVSIDSLGQEGNIVDHIMFNNGAIKEVVKTANGYIYVISEMIKTPTSLRDYIETLSDDYSIFRDMILASGGKQFDRANSKAIGINAEGNTVYDTVWIYTNDFFDNVGFDMNSESLTATMLLFSNDVINNAMDDAHSRLASWQLERPDSLIKDWLLKTAFFSKKYTGEEIQTTEENELKSIYSTVWRTDLQQVDADHPISLSNGVVYDVKQLRFPLGVLIYRLKDYFYYYENCTAEQKEEYFKTTNLTFKNCDTEVAAWTPWTGVWPLHENRIIRFDKPSDLNDSEGFQLDFTPVKKDADGNVTPYLIPPGTYRMGMGLTQTTTFTALTVTILANGTEIAKVSRKVGGNTDYHYDRGSTLPRCFPEGYDASYVREMGGNIKASYYDTDGGKVFDELTIPDVNGDNSGVRIVVRFSSNNWENQSNIKLHHWCLRPIENTK